MFTGRLPWLNSAKTTVLSVDFCLCLHSKNEEKNVMIPQLQDEFKVLSCFAISEVLSTHTPMYVESWVVWLGFCELNSEH